MKGYFLSMWCCFILGALLGAWMTYPKREQPSGQYIASTDESGKPVTRVLVPAPNTYEFPDTTATTSYAETSCDEARRMLEERCGPKLEPTPTAEELQEGAMRKLHLNPPF